MKMDIKIIVSLCYLCVIVYGIPTYQTLQHSHGGAVTDAELAQVIEGLQPQDIPQQIKDEYWKSDDKPTSARGVILLLKALCAYHRKHGTNPLPRYCFYNRLRMPKSPFLDVPAHHNPVHVDMLMHNPNDRAQ